MGPAYHKGVPCPWGSLELSNLAWLSLHRELQDTALKWSRRMWPNIFRLVFLANTWLMLRMPHLSTCVARWWQLKYLLFSPRKLGKWSHLTIIFFKGVETCWNHQLGSVESLSQKTHRVKQSHQLWNKTHENFSVSNGGKQHRFPWPFFLEINWFLFSFWVRHQFPRNIVGIWGWAGQVWEAQSVPPANLLRVPHPYP